MKRLLLVLLSLYILLPSAQLPLQDPQRTDPSLSRQPPSLAHPLGTDHLGRDVLSRLIYGGQNTLRTAGLATLIAIGLGALWGLGLNLAPSPLRPLLRHSMNAFLAVPGLLFALLVLSLLGRGIWALAIAVGLSQVAATARMTHGLARQIYLQEYITAARALGASEPHIIKRHILPNIAPPLSAYSGIVFAYCILSSAALSFLGVGIPPGLPDWGVMLAEGRYAFRAAPWVALYPGLAITATVWLVHWLAANPQRRR